MLDKIGHGIIGMPVGVLKANFVRQPVVAKENLNVFVRLFKSPVTQSALRFNFAFNRFISGFIQAVKEHRITRCGPIKTGQVQKVQSLVA